MAIDLGFLKDPTTLAPPNSEYSILDMPQFTKRQISGKARTFALYVKFPENRWKDIKKAEAISSEGDKIWDELKTEFLERYALN